MDMVVKVGNLKRETVAGMQSCWRSVFASGSKYSPNCSRAHNKTWLEQLHSAGCWALSQVTICKCSHLKYRLFCHLYDLHRSRVKFLPGIIYNRRISHFKPFFYIFSTNWHSRLNWQIEGKPNLISNPDTKVVRLERGLIIQSLSTVDILKNGDSCRDTYFGKTLRPGSNNVSARVGVRFPVKLLNRSKTQLVAET